MTTRLSVKKTYKAYLGGKFIRSESGRSLTFNDPKGKPIAAFPHCSKKDFRNAVVAAEKALPVWNKATAYLKGQIVYRIGEMLETRRDSFIAELIDQGYSKSKATTEIDQSIDRLVYYAGWSDKYQQLFSTVNPVASPHFNFSSPEPTGIITAIIPGDSPLLALVEAIGRTVVGGNSLVAFIPEKHPLTALSFGEVLNCSDVPAGLINLLTGNLSECIETIATHRNLNGILSIQQPNSINQTIQSLGSDNLKRLDILSEIPPQGDPYGILQFQEIKTTWHPIAFN